MSDHTLLHDADVPRMGAWRFLLFLVATESPRMSELRLGVWTALYAAFFIVAGQHLYATSVIYQWLAHIPAACVGWPLAGLGVYQTWAILRCHGGHRLWAARAQTVVSLAFAVGCGASAGIASSAWVFFALNALWSAWTLWRLAPARDPKGSQSDPTTGPGPMNEPGPPGGGA